MRSRSVIITVGVLTLGILIGIAGARFGEKVTLASLSPDEMSRVQIIELPRFIDRNIAVRVEEMATGNETTIFTSPDEGRPAGSERIVWAADSSRFVLLGRHFYALPEARLPGGESLYLLYDLRSGKLWSNAAQQTRLPAFSRGDLEGTEWSSGFAWVLQVGDL